MARGGLTTLSRCDGYEEGCFRGAISLSTNQRRPVR